MIDILRAVELSWCAGFFDGEGCISAWKPTASNLPQIQLAITQGNRETLDRFCEAVGGAVSGPYGNDKTVNHQPYFAWRATGFTHVSKVLTLLWPYLSEPKRIQTRENLYKFSNLPCGKGVKVGDDKGRGSQKYVLPEDWDK